MSKTPKSERDYKKTGALLKKLGHTDMNLRHLTPQKKAAITRMENRYRDEITARKFYDKNPESVHEFTTTRERGEAFENSGFVVLPTRNKKRVRVAIKHAPNEQVIVRRDRVVTKRPIETDKGFEFIRTDTRLFSTREAKIAHTERTLEWLEKNRTKGASVVVRLGGNDWHIKFGDRASFERYIKAWTPSNGDKEKLIEQISLVRFANPGEEYDEEDEVY